jgi:hypothetical protein
VPAATLDFPASGPLVFGSYDYEILDAKGLRTRGRFEKYDSILRVKPAPASGASFNPADRSFTFQIAVEAGNNGPYGIGRVDIRAAAVGTGGPMWRAGRWRPAPGEEGPC